MILSKTPYRISFFGGGTDYPNWFKKNEGEVLSATLDKYCYLQCRYQPPFFGHKIRLVWSKIELCQNIQEVEHPSVREVVKFLKIQTDGLEIYHAGDLPARSGVGSSSVFTVGLINALSRLNGENKSPKQLASEAINVEQNLIKETVGSQDQIAAAYGGFNHITFNRDGSFSVNKPKINENTLKELDSNLLLFFTGVSRTAEKIAETYVPRLDSKKHLLKSMREKVSESIKILTKGSDLSEFGTLLHESWMEKKQLSKLVSSNIINEMYESAIKAGALGGKLTGAGGGGFMLLYAPKSKHENIRKELKGFIEIPFSFENSGSTIIFSD